ncbi:MAG TPA: RidA family protein [Solirubrobacterales bacterium]|nr:RidA family protein [Solirubrobacterales bacterium]
MPATRTPINPWQWSTALGFDQAQLVEGQPRFLLCSGQDAVDANGAAVHPGDMGAQVALALDNLQEVLAAAGMGFGDVVRLNAYTTDVDELFKHWAGIPARFEESGGRFVTSVLGVSRLAAPDLLVLLEATAVA